MDFELDDVQNAISHSTCNTAVDLNAKAIVVFTSSGQSARMISRFRVSTPILGVASDEKVYRKLALSWGVTPMMAPVFTDTDNMLAHARVCAKECNLVKSGDIIVIAAGIPVNTGVITNMIKVEQI